MPSSLEQLYKALRKLGPSEQLLKDVRLELASQVENLLAKAEKLKEKPKKRRIRAGVEKEKRAVFKHVLAEKRKRKKPKPEEAAIRYELPKRFLPRPVPPPYAPPYIPRVYIDTVVFLNVFKREQQHFRSSEKLLKAVEFSCMRGVSSNYSKVEISLILKNENLCKIAFSQLDQWGIKIVDVTERVLLNLLTVRSHMHDINDLIHASTALAEHVDALATRNIRDFAELTRYFLVWPPENIIEKFNIDTCLAKKKMPAE